MKLSIIIVSYNTLTETTACLDSIQQHPPQCDFETIVFDNASHDGSADAVAEHPLGANLIRSEENVGFATGNNLASKHAKGEYLLLLNPDTEVFEGSLQAAVDFAQAHPHCGIVGGRTYFADGSLNYTSCYGQPTLWSVACKGLGLSALFRRSRWLNPESLGGWERDTSEEVAMVTGCFMLMERKLWEELEGFDTGFFMYSEDWDLCLRVRQLGRTCMLCPDATLIHHGGRSERTRPDKMIRLFVSNAQLYRKHWSPLRATLGVRMLDLWAASRFTAFRLKSLVQPQARSGLDTWATVWRNRTAWHQGLVWRGEPKEAVS